MSNATDEEVKITYYNDGQVFTKEWYQNDELHRLDGLPAYIEYSPDNRTKCLKWYQHGKLHNYNGDAPSILQWNENNDPEIIAFYKDGILHQDNGRPAYFEKTDTKFVEKYYNNGNLHRDNNLPAYIEKDVVTGKIRLEKYYNNGNLHRDNLPAYIEIDVVTGKIQVEKYYYNNMLHNKLNNSFWYPGTNNSSLQEPTVIKYYPSGLVQSKQYHSFGKLIEYCCSEIEYYDILNAIKRKIHVKHTPDLNTFQYSIEYNLDGSLKCYIDKDVLINLNYNIIDLDKSILDTLEHTTLEVIESDIKIITTSIGNKYNSINDQPAYITFDSNGNKLFEAWYRSDHFHRKKNLPSWIKYNLDGSKEVRYYYLDELDIEANYYIIIYDSLGNIVKQSNKTYHEEHYYLDNKLSKIYQYYNLNNNYSCKIYYQNGKLNYKIHYRINNTCYFQEWYHEDKLHRNTPDNLPAYIEYNVNNNIIIKKWYDNGKLHNYNDKPAYISYHDNGQIYCKKWYQHNILKRINPEQLPSYIQYYQNGIIKILEWYKDNKLHSYDDLPAAIEYHENGDIKLEQWYNFGLLHRNTPDDVNTLDYKPAEKSYLKKKDLIHKWYKNSKLVKIVKF
jgi:antitoxin component YwqK of YwqJK toxin-antitoxin module